MAKASLSPHHVHERKERACVEKTRSRHQPAGRGGMSCRKNDRPVASYGELGSRRSPARQKSHAEL